MYFTASIMNETLFQHHSVHINGPVSTVLLPKFNIHHIDPDNAMMGHARYDGNSITNL